MRSLSSCFPEFLRSLAADEEASLMFLSALWPQLVGAEIARQSKPLRLRDGCLLIQVASALWCSQLAQMKDSVRESVNRYWGCVLVEKIILQTHPEEEIE